MLLNIIEGFLLQSDSEVGPQELEEFKLMADPTAEFVQWSQNFGRCCMSSCRSMYSVTADVRQEVTQQETDANKEQRQNRMTKDNSGNPALILC